LFRQATSELGTTFYTPSLEEGKYEIVYFSTSRIVKFSGVPSEDMVKLIQISGHKVKKMDVDEITGTVKIVE
jgi:hypothetical protein